MPMPGAHKKRAPPRGAPFHPLRDDGGRIPNFSVRQFAFLVAVNFASVAPLLVSSMLLPLTRPV